MDKMAAEIPLRLRWNIFLDKILKKIKYKLMLRTVKENALIASKKFSTKTISASETNKKKFIKVIYQL